MIDYFSTILAALIFLSELYEICWRYWRSEKLFLLKMKSNLYPQILEKKLYYQYSLVFYSAKYEHTCTYHMEIIIYIWACRWIGLTATFLITQWSNATEKYECKALLVVTAKTWKQDVYLNFNLCLFINKLLMKTSYSKAVTIEYDGVLNLPIQYFIVKMTMKCNEPIY